MKHRKIYLTGLLSIASLMASAQSQVEQLPIHIDKLKPVDIPESAPRTPEYGAEISAYYQNGVIYLQFNEDIGCMDVNVVNLSTGDLWADDACSDNGVETIAVSSAAGSYFITLTTDNGSTYSGEYTIE